MLRQYRYSIKDWIWEIPAGLIDRNEEPLNTAKRELREEAGLVAEEWKSLGTFLGNSSRGCGTYHLFFACGAHQMQEPDSGDLEELELLLWSRSEIENAIDTCQARSLGVITMLLLGLRCVK